MTTKLTDQQKIDIVKEYQEGQTLLKLAEKYSVSRQALSRLLKFRGVQIRNRCKNDSKIDKTR